MASQLIQWLLPKQQLYTVNPGLAIMNFSISVTLNELRHRFKTCRAAHSVCLHYIQWKGPMPQTNNLSNHCHYCANGGVVTESFQILNKAFSMRQSRNLNRDDIVYSPQDTQKALQKTTTVRRRLSHSSLAPPSGQGVSFEKLTITTMSWLNAFHFPDKR